MFDRGNAAPFKGGPYPPNIILQIMIEATIPTASAINPAGTA
jgi:hypothetical protein